MGGNIEKILKTDCTGCKMCGDICPVQAITFEINKQGFWYPVVDPKKCINCGLCLKKCPVGEAKKENERKERAKAYAAWSKNDAIRRESTSGGLYYEFASCVLKQKGYIVGSVYTDDFCAAYHTYSDNEDGLKRIMGSKYFQSDTEGIYKKTEDLLKTGRMVLFTGAPCQISALRSFLGKEYDNLITVDFICRGVPSPLLQKRKIELYKKEMKSPVTFYRDKSKHVGWSNFGELIRFGNGKERFISRWKDDINDCFIAQNLNLRESCYSCRFKCGKMESDITMGDFWGIFDVTEKDMEYGVAALIVNTKKGTEFIEKLGNAIYKITKNIEEIKAGNGAYCMSVERPEKRDEFFELVEKNGLKTTVEKFTNVNLLRKIKREKKIFWTVFNPYMDLLKQWKKIRWGLFIYYNFFSKAVKREKHAFLIPYKGAVLQISKKANIILKANAAINYYTCYKQFGRKTLLKIGDNATVVVNNRLEIAYGNIISVDNGARLELGSFYTGVGSNVICKNQMYFGNHVMLGREVCVFDSDYHDILNEFGEKINPDKPVILEDNVWIGARTMVLKGSHVKEGAIVSANSMVMGEVEGNRCFINKREAKSIGGEIFWIK